MHQEDEILRDDVILFGRTKYVTGPIFAAWMPRRDGAQRSVVEAGPADGCVHAEIAFFPPRSRWASWLT